jgi:glutathione synthase
MRIAYVMDPLSGVNVEKDTTFALMLEAERRGFENYFLEARDLFVVGGKAYGRARPAKVKKVQGEHYTLGPEERLPLEACDAVLMRKDPPFDIDYVFATYILDLAGPKTYVMNSPAGLRDANEKMAILRFPEVIPTTFVSKEPRQLKEFMAELGGEMIIKPLDGCGGAGVFHLKQGDRNINSLLEMSTDNGRRYIMAQRYLPDVRKGDKRVMILDGEPMGAIWRVPPEEDNRGNMHIGGQARKSELDERDKKILAALKPYLREKGLAFVGIDVIGGFLTEINVTSPTGIQEIGRFDGTDPAARTLDFIEAKSRALKGR